MFQGRCITLLNVFPPFSPPPIHFAYSVSASLPPRTYFSVNHPWFPISFILQAQIVATMENYYYLFLQYSNNRPPHFEEITPEPVILHAIVSVRRPGIAVPLTRVTHRGDFT